MNVISAGVLRDDGSNAIAVLHESMPITVRAAPQGRLSFFFLLQDLGLGWPPRGPLAGRAGRPFAPATPEGPGGVAARAAAAAGGD